MAFEFQRDLFFLTCENPRSSLSPGLTCSGHDMAGILPKWRQATIIHLIIPDKGELIYSDKRTALSISINTCLGLGCYVSLRVQNKFNVKIKLKVNNP